MDQEPLEIPAKNGYAKPALTFKTILWWTLLLTAVLAVPAAAIILSAIVHVTGINEAVVFVLGSWLCIYVGLRMLKDPRVMPMFFEDIKLSEHTKQRCVSMVDQIDADMEKWKKRYEKCEPVFMNLSRQPAWDYLDEVAEIMKNIRKSVIEHGTATLKDVRALNSWVEHNKSSAIEGYLQAMKAVYGYAKASFAEQGRHIDDLYPELGNGHMDALISAPRFVKNSALELINTIKNEQPVLAATLATKAMPQPGY